MLSAGESRLPCRAGGVSRAISAIADATRCRDRSSRGEGADDRQNLSGDAARTLRGYEENIGWGDFLMLCGTLHRRVGTNLRDSRRAFIGRIERCPDGTGSHSALSQRSRNVRLLLVLRLVQTMESPSLSIRRGPGIADYSATPGCVYADLC